ncbi:MAG: metalloregulator ArsR/SmtB family transcription factor [Oscillospiraceae bacterium]|jgi:ArsR family transcriptional regulator|nr:metalloregulator ArsR/SmtB family transcription factor [Oscillospiraceae bacterium]
MTIYSYEGVIHTPIETLYDVSELFKVFGDSTRIRILSALRDGPLCVYHLAERLEMGQSAISHQLRLLRNAGLVRARRIGKTVSYALDDAHVAQILDLGLAHVLHKNGGAGEESENEEA